MIASKHLTKIVALLTCACLIFCGFIVYAANAFDTTKITEYQKRMFNDEIISLEIQVAQDDWDALLRNAQAKEWISADVIINGDRFSAVGIRTKGNSSLTQMGGRSGGGSNRYSLQFKMNKYVKGQTYYGLDTFCVNNMMGDATYMKDYLAYDIMNYIGVDTPLVNYASVAVNGEAYGFGIALERYDEAFLDRVYSTSAGELYNVKIGMGRREDFEGDWQDVVNSFPGRRQRGEGETEFPNRQQGDGGEGFSGRPQRGESGSFPDRQSDGGRMPGGEGFPDGFDFGDRQQGGEGRPNMPDGGMDFGGRGGGMGGFGGRGGGSLQYYDDNISSYSAILDNAVGKASDKDKQRVITALENLNAGTDLEKYIDVDATLRYFAAHTVVVNLDSYTSNMAQNYYLYERDGKLTILPWDYNLSFGGFQSGNASSVVNFPIDTPVSGVSMEDRPLLNKLLEVDEYRERYHDYLRQIVEGYFESGLYESTIRALDAKINEYVKNDVNVYYTYEQYEASLPHLIALGYLRAESIKGQLNGTIPSTTIDQREDSSSLIDASGINLSALGSMMGGGGMGRGDWQGGEGNNNGSFGFPGGMFDIDMELMQQAMQILMEAGGELTDEVKVALLELGLTEEMIEMFSGMGGMFGGRDGIGGWPSDRNGQSDGQDGIPQMPDGFGGQDGMPQMPDGFGGRDGTPQMPDGFGGRDGMPQMPDGFGGRDGMPQMPDGFGGQDGMPQMPDGFGGQGRQPGGRSGGQDGFSGGMFGIDMELMQQAMQILMEAGGKLTDEVKVALLELGLTEEQIDMLANMQNGRPGGDMPQTSNTDENWQIGFLSANDGNQANPPNGNDFPWGNTSIPGGMGNAPGSAGQTGTDTAYAVTVGVLLIILIGAIVFVARSRKTTPLTWEDSGSPS